MRCSRCNEPHETGSSTCARCGAVLAEVGSLSDDSLRAGPTLADSRAPAPAASGSRRSAPGSRFEPGEQIGGRYRIGGLVGRGGMGEIYRAEDLKLGQTVALKFLPRDVEKDPVLLERLLEEVRLARQVAHPNVCRVFDVGEVDGRHFLTMEFVDGEDLASLLRRIGRLSEDKAIQVARQICAGLAAAHDQGILHRDLKPANIMLDGRGRAKITDFGLAAVASQVGAEDAGSGTPAYMAPEQHERREVTERSDVYALGLVLHELFTGRPAVDEDSLRSAIESGSVPTPSRPSEWDDRMPPEVRGILLRCLELDPARRPSSPLVVAAALPGGDALAAALAAGDTPSPEMVAEAGATGGLAPRTAVVLLCVVVALLLGQLWLSDRAVPASFPERPKPPAVLADRAAELAAELGLDDGTRATRSWYSWLGSLTGLPSRADGSGSAGPSPLTFAWRKAPAGTLPRAPTGSTWVDPPMEIAGSVRVLMDDQGLVLALAATPPASGEASGATDSPPPPLDWDAALASLGYGDFDLRPAEPEGTPTVWADERRAFTGTWPQAPDLPVRIDAAAAGGRLVWLDTAVDGRRPSATLVGTWKSFQSRTMDKSRLFLFLLLPAVAGVFAWRNHRLRRADPRGAGLAFTIVLIANLVNQICRDPLYNSPRGWNAILHAVSPALLIAVESWLFYLAIEPYVRRTWPKVLIGWSRLAARRSHDPVVGREVLTGMLLGLVGACSRAGVPLLGEWLNLPGELLPRFLASFGGDGGLRNTFSHAGLGVSSGFQWALMALFLVTVARMLVGRGWPIVTGALLTVLIVTLETGMGRGGAIGFLDAGVRAAVILLALSRFGLLACASAIGSYAVLTNVQPTLRTDLWLFGPRFVFVVLLAALAAWACAAAVTGRRQLTVPSQD